MPETVVVVVPACAPVVRLYVVKGSAQTVVVFLSNTLGAGSALQQLSTYQS